MKLTLVGTMFGIDLPPGMNELHLETGRIFKNPIVAQEDLSMSMGANVALYRAIAGNRQFDREVVKYLVDTEMDASDGAVQGDEWGFSMSGSGGVTVGGLAGLRVFSGPVRDELERVVLPLRLGTKARVLMLPVKVQGGSRDTVSVAGFDHPMPEPYGNSTVARLAQEDCDFLTTLAREVATMDLATYQVPIEIFRDSFYKIDPLERGLSLITCLESLFSTSSESIGFKLAYRTSCIIDYGSEDLYKTYVFIKEAYKHRSNLVHGRRSTRGKARGWFVSNVLPLEDIVRRALLTILELRRMGVDLIKEENIDKYVFKEVLAGKSDTLKRRVTTVGRLSTYGRVL